MAKLIIIRGLPGSGKSSRANILVKEIPGAIHVEADMYFMKDTMKYDYDPIKIRKAHSWCVDSAKIFLSQGNTVIVSNTFTRFWEMKEYIEYCKKHNITFEIITNMNNYGSIHDVPEEAMKNMADRFESHESIIKMINNM